MSSNFEKKIDKTVIICHNKTANRIFGIYTGRLQMMNRSHTLWYNRPAENKNEALPLGNGRIGAMVFGGVEHERIIFNEDSLWTGRPGFNDQPNAASAFREAQRLALDGRYAEAQSIIERDFTSNPSAVYLPLCDLYLDFNPIGGYDNYSRALDLQTAVHTTVFESSSVCYTRETFVSEPSQVAVIRLSASKSGKISFSAHLKSQLKGEVRAERGIIAFDGVCPTTVIRRGMNQESVSFVYENDPEKRGIAFGVRLAVCTEGGSINSADGGIEVDGADCATLYFAVRSSFSGWNKSPDAEYKSVCDDDIKSAAEKGAGALLDGHIADWSALYGRCELILPESELSSRPTDERLIGHEEGIGDQSLYALLFHYGRYLTIAASRAGTEPMNLQGIWNDMMLPPWYSNYTVNINTEMNYWPTLTANLEECYEPLLRLIGELRESGRKTAKRYYGARGFCSHHNTDLWRMTTPVGNGQPGCAVWAFWPMSAGWFMRHLCEYFEYTQNEDFLRDTLFPSLCECSEFYIDTMVESKDGKLIFAAATSPENSFMTDDGRICSVAALSAMSQAIIRDVFRMTLDAAALCGIENDTVKTIEKLLPRVQGYECGPSGTIGEWNGNLKSPETHHRHLSHLYGLHPAREITHGSGLENAARLSLIERGDEGTGWSLGWKVNMWARLRDGNHALRLIDMQLRTCPADATFPSHGGTYPNLLGAHPPFQIDGNFGVCAGICEMLIQGTADEPIFLPALPSSWTSGAIRGLRLRGGASVDMKWENGKVTDAVIHRDKPKK